MGRLQSSGRHHGAADDRHQHLVPGEAQCCRGHAVAGRWRQALADAVAQLIRGWVVRDGDIRQLRPRRAAGLDDYHVAVDRLDQQHVVGDVVADHRMLRCVGGCGVVGTQVVGCWCHHGVVDTLDIRSCCVCLDRLVVGYFSVVAAAPVG